MYAKSECEHTGEEGWSRITKSERMNFIDDLLHDSEPLAIQAFILPFTQGVGGSGLSN